jgi:hypothetical protein
LVVPLALPELIALPEVCCTVLVVPLMLPELALTLPVLSIPSSFCFVLSSPFPLLPPATSPRESELPSPDSLCLPLAATVVEAPALSCVSLLPLLLALPEASPPAFSLE